MKFCSQKVAVVLPVYNTALFLRECLESILTQTYENIEVYAVDDASTDESLNILKEYSTNDHRLVVMRAKVNGGVSKARNLALDEIERRQTCDYVAFCDSDDAFYPTMIEEMLFAVNKEKADIGTCCFQHVGFGKPIRYPKFDRYCSFGAESFVEQVFSQGKWKKENRGGGDTAGYVFLMQRKFVVLGLSLKNKCARMNYFVLRWLQGLIKLHTSPELCICTDFVKEALRRKRNL